MTTVELQRMAFPRAPKLRLLPTKGSEHASADAERPELRPVSGPPQQAQPVLIAGGDGPTRSAVLADLAETMAPSTTFEHADAIWEVLVRAPESSMVVVSGELEGMHAESVMQMLVRKAPDVAVVCVAAGGPGEPGRTVSRRAVQAVAS